MATRNDSSDDLLLSTVVVLGPLLTVLGAAYVIERWRRRQAVFRPGQAPPQPTLGDPR
jgi:hypothetical protein